MTPVSSKICVLGVFIAGIVGVGCASTMAEIPTSDGNVLVVQGRGSKSMVAQKCLSADTIKKLISSEIPQMYQGQSCYWVALISTNSTDISRAVSAFIDAKQEFDDKVSDVLAPGAVKPSEVKRGTPDKANAIDAATSILADGLIDSTVTLAQKVQKLPAEQKDAVKEQLLRIGSAITNADLKTKIDAVLATP